MNTRPHSVTDPLGRPETNPTFEKDLEHLINYYSKENGSDTPDFILANYLSRCLDAFNDTLQEREKWYGREINEKSIEAGEDPPSVTA